MATAERMLKDIRNRGLSLPDWGSGRNGQILNSDLERLLAEDWILNEIKHPSWGLLRRMDLEEVQLAYRYDQLTPEEQKEAMDDDNEWVAEEKFNGCRMVITYHPNDGFRAFGRNRSRGSYLPIEYSEIILNYYGAGMRAWNSDIQTPFIADCELMTEGYVETQSGAFTGNSLNAAVAVLQLKLDASHLAQHTTAPLYCVMFDVLTLQENTAHELIDFTQSFSVRKKYSETLVQALNAGLGYSFESTHGFFRLPKRVYNGKQAFLDGLLSQGKEGIVLKNLNAAYARGLNGRRDRNTCIKVKRTMTGSFGDEIDAYIIGHTNSSEWDKKGLIAGLKLAVLLRAPDGTLTEHWLATVSSMPDYMRETLTCSIWHDADTEYVPYLLEEFLGKVLTVDGMDISSRNRRISHARVDWGRGFREDKDASQCIMDEAFLDSQMF